MAFKSRLKTLFFSQVFFSSSFSVAHCLAPAPLKLRPYDAIQIRLLLLIFISHQHKAAGRKTRLDIQKNGCVATAIYSVTMVWKETAFLFAEPWKGVDECSKCCLPGVFYDSSDTPANLLCELNGHLMPCTRCFYGKRVKDVCWPIWTFVCLVLCCLVGCCTWFSCCAANVGLSICVIMIMIKTSGVVRGRATSAHPVVRCLPWVLCVPCLHAVRRGRACRACPERRVRRARRVVQPAHSRTAGGPLHAPRRCRALTTQTGRSRRRSRCCGAGRRCGRATGDVPASLAPDSPTVLL